VALYDKQATSVGGLAEYIEVDKASISRVVERLVIMKLVSHLPGKDRRSGFIVLTEAGKKLVPQLLTEAALNEKQFFGHLTCVERDQMKHIVRKVLLTVPAIQCSGWLDTQEVPMSGADTIIINILKEGKAQQKPYPQIFEELKHAGVTSYTVSWLSGYDAIYTGSFGMVHEPAPAGFASVVVAQQADLESAKKALRAVQQRKINFVDWAAQMAAAGISHYTVDMGTRAITYYNPAETEYFVESVPGVV
jgi:uncharacterized protein YbcV (DUF1398 family)